jgi:hypothetical protein
MEQDDQRMNELRLDLLRSVLPNPRWDTTAYLDWVYDRNPMGELIPIDVIEDGRIICHIGGVPVQLRSADHQGNFLLMLNSATAADAQGRGLYVKALIDLCNQAAELGAAGAYGVTNLRSTGPATKVPGATLTGSLPVRLVIPTFFPSRRVRTFDCTDEFLDSDEFVKVTAGLDNFPVRRFVTRWTTDTLRWRLGFPCAAYKLHVSDELVAITTRASFKGMPVTVLMKFLPRAADRRPLDPWPLISTACWRHRTPLAIYAGYNAIVAVPGIRIKQERLPAPLNLVVRSLSAELRTEDFQFEIFEFLDFDAY